MGVCYLLNTLLVFSFDVVLDPFGGEIGDEYSGLLSKWKGAVFVTLAPPVLSKTDQLGVGLGLVSAAQSFTSSALQKVTTITHRESSCLPALSLFISPWVYDAAEVMVFNQ